MNGIPSLVLVCAGYDRYLVLSITTFTRERRMALKTTVVENPRQLVLTGRWRTDGEEKPPVECCHQRLSCEGTLEYYYNTMTQTSRYLTVSWHDRIPVYNMTSPNLVLPTEFYKVYTANDRARKWHFIGADFPLISEIPSPPSAQPQPPPAPPPAPAEPQPQPQPRPAKASPSHIPTHIFKSFVESAILKKETCSITMEEITMENAGMTRCGHLFDKDALATALNMAGKCPQCRAPAKISQIQTN